MQNCVSYARFRLNEPVRGQSMHRSVSRLKSVGQVLDRQSTTVRRVRGPKDRGDIFKYVKIKAALSADVPRPV